MTPRQEFTLAAVRRGWDLVKRGQEAEAVRAFERAIELYPNWGYSYFSRAYVYVDLVDQPEKLNQAKQDLDVAIRINPTVAEYYSTRGLAWARLGNLEQSTADFTEAIRLDPNDANTFYNRAVNQQWCGEFALAIADYREAIRLDPNSMETHCNLAMIQAYCPDPRFRDGKQAVQSATKACELTDFADAKNLSTLAYALASTGQFDEAVGRMEQAIKCVDSPDEAKAFAKHIELFRRGKAYHETYLDLAYSHLSRGDFDRTLQALDLAAQDDPNSPFPHVGRARVFLEQQKYDEGIAAMWDAIRRNPGDVGLGYDPHARREKPFTHEALTHGEAQLKQMLQDRPAMAQHIHPGDELWNWTVRKFAGEDVDGLIFWDATDPKPCSAMCIFIGDGAYSIRIRSSFGDAAEYPPRTFSDLWSSAIFELHNVPNCFLSEAAANFGSATEMSGEQFVMRTFGLEEPTIQQTRAFYLRFFLPWLRDRGVDDAQPDEWQASNFPPHGDDRERVEYVKSLSHGWWDHNLAWHELICAEDAFEKRDFARAKQLLEKVQSREENLSIDQLGELYYQVGSLHGAAGESQLAVKAFDKALAHDPNCHRAALARALERLFDEDSHQQAMQELNELAEIEEMKVEVLRNRGIVYFVQEDFEKAAADFDQLVQDDAENPINFMYRGEAWHILGQFDRAIADFTEAIRLMPNLQQAYLLRAESRQAQKKFDDALADLRKAVEIAADSADAQHRLAKLLAECPDESLRNYPAAIAAATRGCELTQWKDAAKFSPLVGALLAIGDFAEATRRADQAAALIGPTFFEAQSNPVEDSNSQSDCQHELSAPSNKPVHD